MAPLSPGQPLSTKEYITVEDLARESLVMGSSSEWPTFRRVVVDMFQNAGLVMTVDQGASSLTGVLGLETAGVGITVSCGGPHFCVGSVIEARPIVAVPRTTVETHLAWRRSSVSGAMRRFVETIDLIGRESTTV
jgi:LysR family transcriptional regulator, benzoate and cis,cis-muconate-responsive activator of ben and cat genes